MLPNKNVLPDIEKALDFLGYKKNLVIIDTITVDGYLYNFNDGYSLYSEELNKNKLNEGIKIWRYISGLGSKNETSKRYYFRWRT